MALWLVVHRPDDGCFEEGIQASPISIGIFEAVDASAAKGAALSAYYPRGPGERGGALSTKEWAKYRSDWFDRHFAKFEAVPVGQFVTLGS